VYSVASLKVGCGSQQLTKNNNDVEVDSFVFVKIYSISLMQLMRRKQWRALGLWVKPAIALYFLAVFQAALACYSCPSKTGKRRVSRKNVESLVHQEIGKA